MLRQDVVNLHGNVVIFITLKIKTADMNQTREVIADFCNRISAIINSFNQRYPESGFSMIFGFGAFAWKTLFPNIKTPKRIGNL